ncbi:biotin-dependent carboxyltransferase [Thermaerobacter sp. FW80]|uniref:5-oxoprolinase subunit C family protein n=1 Tax=Thermaerobacter sp. FW80 TaxID=2546351 RepID=UPI001074DC5E|nr:biotin-dependent carboxyltransferase family protein [Thermaerobacter sp. FW80]QBS36658.1 biotin-dependent carboxyltransferase [Thermaerobacter sp. FW80]
MAEVFEVVAPGLLTTVQDRGRHGYQAFGVPVAGAVDEYALRIANLLVGNDENAAGLEITLLGPTLRVLAPTVIAVTGADLGATRNGQPLPLWEAVAVEPGDEIRFRGVKQGCRAYLAVAGGIDVPPVMGSRSTYLRGGIGGIGGRALKAGDVLEAGGLFRADEPATTRRPRAAVCGRRGDADGSDASPGEVARQIAGRRVPAEFVPRYGSPITLRVVLGPQDDHFTPAGVATFLSAEYVVTVEADRMGCRLDGPTIEHAGPADIISDGIPLGAVQVPGHGRPIVMLADRQTTGGYPKIATVISVDIPRIAQAKPGDRVRFAAVSRDEAVRLYREREEGLRRLAQRLA